MRRFVFILLVVLSLCHSYANAQNLVTILIEENSGTTETELLVDIYLSWPDISSYCGVAELPYLNSLQFTLSFDKDYIYPKLPGFLYCSPSWSENFGHEVLESDASFTIIHTVEGEFTVVMIAPSNMDAAFLLTDKISFTYAETMDFLTGSAGLNTLGSATVKKLMGTLSFDILDDSVGTTIEFKEGAVIAANVGKYTFADRSGIAEALVGETGVDLAVFATTPADIEAPTVSCQPATIFLNA
ncbi:MAG: hypothetical protein ACERIH_11335, partial [Labilibaculum antarcticum]